MPGETIFAALQREFMEELGLTIHSAEEWCGGICLSACPRAAAFLHQPRLAGEPQSLEGQAFAWQGTVGVEPLLPATIPLLAWLDELRYPA
jgi:8-oxo-dGTP diphosphatase